MASEEILEALREIKKRNHKKLLLAEDVVEAARPETNPLHHQFNWDDSDAASKYRIWQAQQLIASVRVIIDGPPEREVRAFVSVKPDRARSGGGYRGIEEVLNNATLRQSLIASALDELKAFCGRYEEFHELGGICNDIRRLIQNRKRRKKSA